MNDEYVNDNVDSLADDPLSMPEVEQGRKDASMAAGWYTTDPEVATVTEGRAEKSGRKYMRFFGRVVGPEEGVFGFGWSWVRVNKFTPDGQDTGKPDNMYQAYTALVGLYEKMYEVKPEKAGDLKKFVESQPIQLRIIKGREGGNFLGNMPGAVRLPGAPN